MRVPSRQTIRSLVNKLRTTGLLTNKQKNKRLELTEKLDDIGTRLEHAPRKSLKRLAQETGVSKSSTGAATQLLKLRPCKITAIHARLGAARSSQQSSFLQLVSSLSSEVRSIRN
jgi:DNA-binding IclR family transcriptional regulator